MRRWQSFTLRAPLSAEEYLSAALHDSGTQGIEVLDESAEEATLAAFFDASEKAEQLLQNIHRAWQNLGQPHENLKIVGRALWDDHDWVDQWREHYRPIRIGSDFLIMPSWHAERRSAKGTRQLPSDFRSSIISKSGARWTIVLDPQNAFGSGTHASTRLCLLGIAEFYHESLRALDVGTGSGILAIAMACLCAKRAGNKTASFPITAIDSDPDAIRTARKNASRNEVSDRVRFQCISLSDLSRQAFSFVVANLTALDLEQNADKLPALCRSAGLLLLAGLQSSDSVHLCTVYRERGFRLIKKRTQENWSLLVLRKSR
jgi:ribosomal protein L11 methyltransferase